MFLNIYLKTNFIALHIIHYFPTFALSSNKQYHFDNLSVKIYGKNKKWNKRMAPSQHIVIVVDVCCENNFLY